MFPPIARESSPPQPSQLTTNLNGPRTYSFPLLKPSQIIASFRDMKIPVAEEDLKQSDVGAIRKVLEFFIELTMGITREEMNQPQFAGVKVLSYPELYEEAIVELTFFRKASTLMQACGINDFNMKDILTPNPKRVRRQFSALINFSKFRDERVSAFSNLRQTTQTLQMQQQLLQEENERLQRELQMALSASAAEAPAIEQVTHEIETIAQQIAPLNRQQSVLRATINKLRVRYEEAKKEVVDAKSHQEEADRMIQDLENKVVNSPERLKQEITTMAMALEQAKEEMSAMDRSLRELQLESQMFSRAEKDLLELLEDMTQVERTSVQCQETKEQVRLHKKEMEENRHKAVEIDSQRKRLETLAELKREQSERLREDLILKEQAATHALSATRQELKQLEHKHRDVRQRIMTNKETARELEWKMRDEEQHYRQELQGLEQMLTRLRLASQQYNNQILDVIRSDGGIP